ncbi:hypothetical protein BKI52_31380 [marine bacterium AO1-C]|nr:hypothetical protein BKI52_31380 [marine bacterium AO1-C]
MQTEKIGRSLMKTRYLKLFQWLGLSLILTLANVHRSAAQFSSITGQSPVCVGETADYTLLSSSNAASWDLVSGGTLITPTSDGVSVSWTSAGFFTLKALDSGGNTIAQKVIEVQPQPTITISGTKVVAYNGVASLTVSGASSYTWKYKPSSSGSWTTISSPSVVNITQNTIFEAEGTNSNGCRGKATWEVLVIQEPSVSANFGQGWADVVTFSASYQPTTTPGANGNGWYWYTTPSGGSPLNSYNTHPVLNLSTLGVHTFYVASYNSTYGVTSTRKAVNILRLELQPSDNQTGCNGNNAVSVVLNGWPSNQSLEEVTTNFSSGPHYIRYNWYNNVGDVTAARIGSSVTMGPFQEASRQVYVEAVLNDVALSGKHSLTITPTAKPGQPTVNYTNCGENVTLTGGQSGDVYHLLVQQLVGNTWQNKVSPPANSTGVFSLTLADHLTDDIRYVAYIMRNGCKSDDQIVTVPVVPLPSNYTVTNCGETVTLTGATSGDMYHLIVEELVSGVWQQKTTLAPNTTGVFNPVTADRLNANIRYRGYISRNGCEGQKITISVPTFDFSSTNISLNAASVCQGQNIVATVNHPAGLYSEYHWLVNGVAHAVTSGNVLTYPTTTTGTVNISVKLKDANTGCLSTATVAAGAVQINNLSSPTYTLEQNSQCVGSKVLIRASKGGHTDDYRWYKNNVEIEESKGKGFLVVTLTNAGDTYALDIVNAQGCASPKTTITLPVQTALPKPFVISAPTHLVDEGAQTIQIGGAQAGQVYEWSVASPNTIVSQTQDAQSQMGELKANFSQTTVVRVKIKYTTGDCEGETLCIPVRVITKYNNVSESDLNVTGVQTVRVKQTDKTNLPGLSVISKEALWQKTYLDGMGRPIQSINQEASPNQLDVVQTMVYDEIGRSPVKYLPFTVADDANPKSFKPNGVTKAKGFYNAQPNVAHSAHPYARTDFEPSPLNRSFVQYAPGEEWVGANKAVKTTLHTNIDPNTATNGVDKIRLLRVNNVLGQGDVTSDRDTWILDALEKDQNQQLITTYEARNSIVLNEGFTVADNDPTITLEINTGDNNVPMVAGFYAQGELVHTSITDEDGKVTEEFKNKTGQVVLKRAKVADNTWTQTYYAYDDFGQLSYVLPPEAVKVLEAHNWDFTNATVCVEIPRLWYRYYYDGRKRLITKEVPGAGKVMMVYDRRDRLVLSQDANQRQRDEWSFTKYDELNRPVMTGLYTSTQTRAQLQAALDANFGTTGYIAHEKFDLAQTNNHFYSNQSFPTTELNIHSVTYYDNYAWKNGSVEYDYDKSGGLADFEAEPLIESTLGLVTAAKTKILGSTLSDPYLTTVSYYDRRGRVVQTVADNHVTSNDGPKGKDRMMTQYAFDGLVKQSVVQHYNVDNNTTHYVTQWTEYDQMGRVLKTYQEIQEGGVYTYKSLAFAKQDAKVEKISELGYNELGQLMTKKLGTKNWVGPLTTTNGLDDLEVLQTIDFKYNIRGWMTHLNDASLNTSGTDNDLFGFELTYARKKDNNAGYLNGNIGQMIWQSSLDGVQRQYDYTYDGLNRLTSADYSDNDTKAYGQNERPDFDVSNLTYDLNGNIKTLTRKGLLTSDVQLNRTFGIMDDLTYQYRGNQLTQVEDAENSNTSGVAGDFRNKHVATVNNPDYSYDVNGNMIQDKNKEITSITYNYLNLPTVIEFTEGRRIEYTYDAAGIKLRKDVYENGVKINWTNYVGSFVYEGDNLQFIHTAEGRTLAPGTVEGNLAFLYEYHYKDHLGNLRVAFREGQQVTSLATFEVPMTDKDQGFEYDNAIVKPKPNGVGNAAQLGGDTQPLGAWKTFKVTKGDKVEAEVFAQVQGTPSQSLWSNLEAFVTNLASGGSPNGDVSSNNPNTLLVGIKYNPNNASSQSPGLPVAYLRYVLYNETGDTVRQSGRVFVSLIANSPNWERLHFEYDVPENGILQIYTANESSDKNVWFDDLRVTFTPQLIVQENHYYPFGLGLTGLEKNNSSNFRYLYNVGTEREKNFGLQWDETPFRSYDPQLGRFHQVDPLADLFTGITPYNYAFNDPAGLNDPTGLCPDCPDPSKAKKGDTASPNGVNYTFDGTSWVRDGENLDLITVTAKRETDTNSGTPSTANPSNKTVDDNDGYDPLGWLLPGAAAAGVIPVIEFSTESVDLIRALARSITGREKQLMIIDKEAGETLTFRRIEMDGRSGYRIDINSHADGKRQHIAIFEESISFLQKDVKELEKTWKEILSGELNAAALRTYNRGNRYLNKGKDGINNLLMWAGLGKVFKTDNPRKSISEVMRHYRKIWRIGESSGNKTGHDDLDDARQVAQILLFIAEQLSKQ